MWLFVNSVQTIMDSFQLFGAAASEAAPLPVIASSFGRLVGLGDSDKFVTFLFETNPLDHRCDTRIVMTAKPLEVIYDAVSFFRRLLLWLCKISCTCTICRPLVVWQIFEWRWLAEFCNYYNNKLVIIINYLLFMLQYVCVIKSFFWYCQKNWVLSFFSCRSISSVIHIGSDGRF